VSFEEYAARIIKKCATQKQGNTCYDKEIPKLSGVLSMEDVFKVTALIQENDTSYTYCHVLGHRLATLETKKDVSRWKEVVGRCPVGVCSNGCVHGAFQERYRSDVLEGEEYEKAKNELKDICEVRDSFNPSGLEQGSCYHALGHLLMYISGADIIKSVASCDEVGLKSDGRDFRGLCYDGAFMQIFQPLEPEDIALVYRIKQTKETARDFCSQFDGEKKTSCFTESWPLFFEEIITPRGLLNFCSNTGSEGFEACMQDILYVLPIQFRFEEAAVRDFCLGLPSIYRGRCFSLFAVRLMEIDYGNIKRAVDFCQSSASYDKEGVCFSELVKNADFIFSPDSEEFKELCSRLPAPWQEECLNGKNKEN
jgi:hypothetical protein